MSCLGEANSIVHEVEKRFGVHMPDDLRHYIESKIMQAVQKDSEGNYKNKQYWMNKELKKSFPSEVYLPQKCAFKDND